MVNPTTPDDAQRAALAGLLARVALGDRNAFASLYEATKSTLFAVVMRVAGDRAQAEDVLQDVYVNVWRGARTYDAARNNPMAWLVSVARYRAIDHARQRQHAVITVSAFRSTGHGDGGDDDMNVLDTMPSALPGPAELHEQANDAQTLIRCMKALTPEQRQAISLAYYQGCSHSEIASHLAEPLGSVKSWVRRGLMALQRCMGVPVSTAGGT